MAMAIICTLRNMPMTNPQIPDKFTLESGMFIAILVA